MFSVWALEPHSRRHSTFQDRWFESRGENCLRHLRDCKLQPQHIRDQACAHHERSNLSPRRVSKRPHNESITSFPMLPAPQFLPPGVPQGQPGPSSVAQPSPVQSDMSPAPFIGSSYGSPMVPCPSLTPSPAPSSTSSSSWAPPVMGSTLHGLSTGSSHQAAKCSHSAASLISHQGSMPVGLWSAKCQWQFESSLTHLTVACNFPLTG